MSQDRTLRIVQSKFDRAKLGKKGAPKGLKSLRPQKQYHVRKNK